jgi:hypothetical protein
VQNSDDMQEVIQLLSEFIRVSGFKCKRVREETNPYDVAGTRSLDGKFYKDTWSVTKDE